MPSLPVILLLLFHVVATLYWSLAFVRVMQILRRRPTVRAGLDLPPARHATGEPPLVSIVIPAHNEARVIRQCARSLLAQSHRNLELIFVLDRCTDRTADLLRDEVAGDPRVQVIENDHCPDGWAGKCHAAQRGADCATGEWLLFTDADVTFDPDLVRASIAVAHHRRLGLFSLLSTLTNRLPFERFIQPMASYHLLRMFPLDRVNRVKNGRPFANGQFLLFQRDVYRNIGGHHSVHGDLLEDIAFARVVAASGASVGLALADRMLTVSMYDSFGSFKRGWARIFIEACRRRPLRLASLGVRTLLSGFLLPLLQIVGMLAGGALIINGMVAIGIALLAASMLSAASQLLTLGMIYRGGHIPLSGLPLHPLGSLVTATIMCRAAWDLRRGKPVSWGGRSYVLGKGAYPHPSAHSFRPQAQPGKPPD